MCTFSFVLQYVRDPSVSAAFYAQLLDAPVIEQSPTFAMLPLRDGVMLGLWQRDGVEPKATASAGAGEIAFTVANKAAVDAAHATWSRRGLTIVQSPTAMEFGYTFVALDPDGHRVRVFVPGA